MATHPAVAITEVRGPLSLIDVPTVAPKGNEVRVLNLWTACTPFDLHQADGGLYVTIPQVMGDNVGGKVVEVGEDVKHLKVSDEVFGLTFREQKERAFQQYVTAPETLLAKLPTGLSLQASVVIPDNFVTAWHAMTTDLSFTFPFPKPAAYTPPAEFADPGAPILIWGGAGSVGQYALQILKHYGYRNVITTASARHHTLLRELGATHVYDYTEPDVVDKIVKAHPRISRVLDCIGSVEGSIKPISQLAKEGTLVSLLLPFITKFATKEAPPVFESDPHKVATWGEGVKVVPVRALLYLENAYHAEHLQRTIMASLVAEGAIRPNAQRLIEGKTMLERAQKAIDLLRDRAPSGERLVWRVADTE